MGIKKQLRNCYGCGHCVYTAMTIPRCKKCQKSFRSLQQFIRRRDKKNSNKQTGINVLSSAVFSDCTHLLKCTHCIAGRSTEYYMDCIVLGKTKNGKTKVIVFGDRNLRGREHKKQLKYVGEGRVFPNNKLKTMKPTASFIVVEVLLDSKGNLIEKNLQLNSCSTYDEAEKQIENLQGGGMLKSYAIKKLYMIYSK